MELIVNTTDYGVDVNPHTDEGDEVTINLREHIKPEHVAEWIAGASLVDVVQLQGHLARRGVDSSFGTAQVIIEEG